MQTRPTIQLAAMLIAALALTGCANMTTTALDDTSAQSSLSGIVHGGRQPVANATVTLWAAGNAGYGSAATSLATTTTSAAGTFAFQPTPGYACPSTSSTTASQYLYLTVSGGQPTTGVTNAQAAFLLALGSCSTVKSSNPTVNIDELTTVASIAALQQFFKPDTTNGLGSIGTSSTNITGLANAMAVVPNMVNTATGQSFATTTASAAVTGYTTNPVVTITPEQSKLDTMADILAACVNSSGTGSSTCAPLFANAGSATPLDTLQAAYYMAATPAGVGTAASCTTGTAVTTAPSICTLYGLVTSTSPYQPTLAGAPTDWTLGITYGSTSTNTAGAYLFNYPTYIAVDATGNVWSVNDASTSATGTSNSVTELSNAGTPLNQVLTGSTLIGPGGIAFDPSGNFYVPNYGSSSALQTSVVEYTSTGATNTFTVNKGPQRLAVDGKGNVFVLEPSYKGLGDLEEIPAGAATGTTATTLATGLTTDFSNLAIDSNYTVWVTGGGTGSVGGTSGYPYIFQFLYSSTSPNYPSTPSATVNVGGVTAPEQAISIDNSNNVFVQNYGKETLAEFSGTTTASGNTNAPFNVAANLSKPEFQITDGAGNLWITDAATATASPAGSVFEVSNAGATLTPATGFFHTYSEPYGIALDASGNVWIANYNSAGSATVASFITEIVGAAVPVTTPLAACLPATPGGTSKLGTRP